MIERLLPTLFYVGCGFILCLLCVAVYVAVAAYDDRRAARDAEHAARPHSARVGTAGQDAAAILHAAIATCPGYETTPNPCRCPCYGCKHHCGAHQPDDTDLSEQDIDRRRQYAAVLRGHGMVHLGDEVPDDEYECCADAVIAVADRELEQLREQVQQAQAACRSAALQGEEYARQSITKGEALLHLGTGYVNAASDINVALNRRS